MSELQLGPEEIPKSSLFNPENGQSELVSLVQARPDTNLTQDTLLKILIQFSSEILLTETIQDLNFKEAVKYYNQMLLISSAIFVKNLGVNLAGFIINLYRIYKSSEKCENKKKVKQEKYYKGTLAHHNSLQKPLINQRENLATVTIH